MNPTPLPAPSASNAAVALLSLVWDQSSWTFDLAVSVWLILLAAALLAIGVAFRWWAGGFTFKSFEIDQAEIGVGSNKIQIRPNLTDRQVAYSIWVELSTRKIGLPIDLDHDVISEIYDSWYQFFTVTRELLKGVSVTHVKRQSTQAIINLSIEVLNEGLRPHLTRWQARFRSWYDRELKRFDEGKGTETLDPQQVQVRFPQYEELKSDMLRVNRGLISYRGKMRQLIMKG